MALPENKPYNTENRHAIYCNEPCIQKLNTLMSASQPSCRFLDYKFITDVTVRNNDNAISTF